MTSALLKCLLNSTRMWYKENTCKGQNLCFILFYFLWHFDGSINCYTTISPYWECFTYDADGPIGDLTWAEQWELERYKNQRQEEEDIHKQKKQQQEREEWGLATMKELQHTLNELYEAQKEIDRLEQELHWYTEPSFWCRRCPAAYSSNTKLHEHIKECHTHTKQSAQNLTFSTISSISTEPSMLEAPPAPPSYPSI